MYEKFEQFEEIFWEVGEAHGLSCWWEVYDSEVFDEAEKLIAERLGNEMLESDEYADWCHIMAMDL